MRTPHDDVSVVQKANPSSRMQTVTAVSCANGEIFTGLLWYHWLWHGVVLFHASQAAF